MINSAIDQYAIESNKNTGANVDWTDVKTYLKIGSTLYNSGGSDMLAHSFGFFSVDTIPKVPSTTFDQLSDIAPPNSGRIINSPLSATCKSV